MNQIKLQKSSQVETRDFGNGLDLKILFDREEGAKNLDFGTVEIAPHCPTPMHVRNFEEVIYVLEGQGETITQTGEVFTMGVGDCILIPAGVTHCHANNTDAPMKQIYIFAPQSSDEMQESLRNLKIKKG